MIRTRIRIPKIVLLEADSHRQIRSPCGVEQGKKINKDCP